MKEKVPCPIITNVNSCVHIFLGFGVYFLFIMDINLGVLVCTTFFSLKLIITGDYIFI